MTLSLAFTYSFIDLYANFQCSYITSVRIPQDHFHIVSGNWFFHSLVSSCLSDFPETGILLRFSASCQIVCQAIASCHKVISNILSHTAVCHVAKLSNIFLLRRLSIVLWLALGVFPPCEPKETIEFQCTGEGIRGLMSVF